MTVAEWQDAMSKVSEHGYAIPPEGLLRTLASQGEPRSALSDMDRSNRLFASLHEEFPVFRQRLPNEAPPSAEDQDRGVGVLRWLITEFREWSSPADPELERFVALVVVIQSCPWDSEAWFSFSGSLLFNAQLVERLQQMLASATVTIRIQDLRGNAKAEDATVTQLRAAGASKDWKTLLFMRRRIRNLVWPNSLIIQAVRYLYRHASSALVAGTSEIQDVSFVQQILESLTVEQSFQFASQTDNGLIQLMAIEIASENRQPRQTFSSEEERSLAGLLNQILLNEQNCSAFLALHNEHPSAYPSLQVPIGRALAVAPESALAAYVQSVGLSAPCNLADRQGASVCLAVFRSGANETGRKFLWEKAFQRWSSWRFDGAGRELLQPTFSELDYAVIGYLKECVDGSESSVQLSRVEAEINHIEQNWFRSITDLYTSRNRLLSRLQQFAHALNPASEDDWLAESPRYQPTGGESLYAALRFNVRGGL
jgi:hypothetical protein